ncbi:ammonium transporter [Micromonospora aurantiaca]|uniref:Ammonium transporter n=2 Tax=Micromonospora TaxID=1873 RepID=A0A1C6SY91_9ACTN|nr:MULTISPECIES: ammonium transporter [Micromonospora]ADL44938.1 ammonium transporter [Micromonospora aurantiaca ATCC 27029]ADU07158.1 ammonium transporter [Micromonospora sp. L5]AXH91090.1 ammonium transporter [Micromonospora aurantiaca]AYF29197.1 ammonia channel protein [Micromonospora tulbaghiae]KAB1116260.1 ammonium transporter [Micromonospora aurantiaca]
MEIDTGNTAWLLVSTALVLLMTPGLALFYGGLNRSKGVLNMMMMSFSSIGLVSILWLFYGFTVAFGEGGRFWGDLGQYLGTKTFVGENDLWGETGIPIYVFIAFQMMFAIITVALISGALSDRVKFAGWLLFAFGWATLVYFPVAHMVWGGGLIGGDIGALDFAGGTAVHINAGAAALALVLVLGKRVGWPRESMKPHNVPMVALGAALLWFGWFGFNAGSELTADGVTALAFINTQVATAAALLGWIVVEWLRDGKPTLVGASSGAIAGLVAITPACAFITPAAAVLLGVVAGAVCALAVGLKYRLGYDDSLDVVGVHFVGGWIGCLWIGLFGTASVSSLVETDGLFVGGDASLLGKQAISALIVSVYSFVVAFALGFVIDKTIGLRVSAEAEVDGIDIAEHAESGYDLSPTTGSSGGAFAMAGIGAGKPAAEPAVETDESAPVSEKVAG